jgi:hypothetical protein
VRERSDGLWEVREPPEAVPIQRPNTHVRSVITLAPRYWVPFWSADQSDNKLFNRRCVRPKFVCKYL